LKNSVHGKLVSAC